LGGNGLEVDRVKFQAAHLYLLTAQLFCLLFVICSTARSQVSNLFIANWGAEVTYNELEQLELEF